MANRYWVGGTANWDGTAGTKWATTSGGAGGASVPTTADDVFFSNLSTGTCTISAGNTGAKSINCTGFAGTIQGFTGITVAGSITLVAGMTYSMFGLVTITGTGTITSAGKVFGLGLNVNGSGITVTLGDALTNDSSFTLTQGTLNLNGFTLSTERFASSNANTRAITFGSGNIALTSTTAAAPVLGMGTATNFTYTGTGGFTRNMAATATVVFGTTGGTVSNAPNLTVNAGSSALTITTNSWFNNLIFTGSTSAVPSTNVNIAGNLTLASGGTYTAVAPTYRDTGTLTSNGKTLGPVTVDGSGITVTLGDALSLASTDTFTLTQGTLNLNGFTLSTGTFVSDNANTRAITFGSGNIALTSTTAAAVVLSMGTATNFTYTGTGGFTRVQNATATINFGGTTGDTSTNAPNFTVTSGSAALTITGGSSFKAFTLTGSTCTVSGSSISFYGDVALASGGTYTSLGLIIYASQTFNSFGKTLSILTFVGTGGTLTLGSALNITVQFSLNSGTLSLNGFTLSAGAFSSSNTGTRAIAFGSSNIALTSTTASTTVLDMANATNFTYTGTGGFTRNMAATATVVFGTTAGSTTNAPNLTVNAGASDLTITADSWFNNLIFTGSTSTVTSTNVNIAGDLTLATGGTYTAVVPTYRDTGTLTSSGKTLSALTVNGASIVVTCADALALTNALTFTLGTLKLRQSVTSTVGSLVTTGTTLKFLESASAGTQATISDSSGTNTVTYLSIKDSNATGGAVFDATSLTNVNAGNNTGWNFGGGGGNFMMFFM